MTGITFVVKKNDFPQKDVEVEVSECKAGALAVGFGFSPNKIKTNSLGQAFFDTSVAVFFWGGPITGKVTAQKGFDYVEETFQTDQFGNGTKTLLLATEPGAATKRTISEGLSWILGNVIVITVIIAALTIALAVLNKYSGGVLTLIQKGIGRGLRSAADTLKRKRTTGGKIKLE